MEIHTEDGASGGRYWLTKDGDTAEMTFSRASPRLIIIDHTGVPDSMRGQGAGQALAAFAVEAARSGGWKIMPLCPFFKAQALRHAEWHDVISK